MPTKKFIYQLKITLFDSKPPIWRRIQIPTSATFWDLHSAIQDVFKWNHSHLHHFYYNETILKKQLVFGIPSEDDEMYEMEILPSLKHKISKYLNLEEPNIKYVYDLGDNWIHLIQVEEILPAEKGVSYPICLKGKRNSPPDDCGGIWGYADLLEILADPKHEEYESTKEWVESMKEGPFDPEHFDPKEVIFVDPKKRFDESFG
jgi:hypothetical protein